MNKIYYKKYHNFHNKAILFIKHFLPKDNQPILCKMPSNATQKKNYKAGL